MNWKRIVATCVTAGVVVGGLGMGIAAAADGTAPAAKPRVAAADGERLKKACANLDALKAKADQAGTKIDAQIAKLQERLGEAKRPVVKNRIERRIDRLTDVRGRVGTGVAKLTEACATAG